MSTAAYVDTTPIQALRAFAAWLLAVGLIALFFTGGQLLVWDDPLWAIIAVATTAAGGVLIWRTQRRLRTLDAANRPFLFGESGGEIMHARADLDKVILTVSRWLLALFIVLGVAFFFMLSAASCGERIDGYCGQVGSPSDAVMTWAQFVAVAVGAAWVAAVGLRRTHEKESERIDLVVAEGQRSRRRDHPLSGMERTGWE